MRQQVIVKTIDSKSKIKYINNVTLADNLPEFVLLIKNNLNSKNTLKDYFIMRYCCISEDYKDGDSVLLYKINKNIFALNCNFLDDIPHLPQFESWAALDIKDWIRENGEQLEKLVKLKGFW